MSIDKIIVTNRSRLVAKYKAAGAKRIDRALARLVAADQRRGIATEVIHLDRPQEMQAHGAQAVTSAADLRQHKRAIDQLFAAVEPQYLMLLGAADVVPHLRLRNPVGGTGGDDDRDVPSDLPYACSAGFGRDTSDFVGPDRAVGRLPDVAGAKSPTYLLALIRDATRWRRRPASAYESGFAISAEVWKGSTRMTARKLFGSQATVELSPPDGPKWKSGHLGRRVHLINCHGAPNDHRFFGESPSGEYPIAHRSTALSGTREGAVVAVECCYGGELYDPSLLGVPMGIANAYLKRSAYGVFASTNIAYGPPTGNGAADLICRYFVMQVMKGASLGRAALEARQEFVRRNSPLDPVDLKTLAQFLLLGDPSVHPSRRASASVSKAPRRKAPPEPAGAGGVRGRKLRRRRLRVEGHRLSDETLRTASRPDTRTTVSSRRALEDLKRSVGMEGTTVRSYALHRGGGSELGAARKTLRNAGAVGSSHPAGTFHVMVEKKSAANKRAASAQDGIQVRRVVVALEQDGKLSTLREYQPR